MGKIIVLFSRFRTKKSEQDCYNQMINVQARSGVVELLKTEDLRKLVNFKKNPEKLGIDGKPQSATQKPNFDSCSAKHSTGTFKRNTYFT